MAKLKPHPLSEIFTPLSSEEFEKLSDHIAIYGLQTPIVRYEGKILDGWHRYQACEQSGIEPRFEDFEGEDALGFVIGANLHRRHLDPSQRAMVAARIADLEQGEIGKNNLKPQQITKSANLRFSENGPKTQVSHRATHESAAKAVSVSPRLVDMASKVLDKAPAKLIAKVDSGEITLNAAHREIQSKEAAKKKVVDAIGYPIPDELVIVWNRRNEVVDIMRQIATVEARLKQYQQAEDPIFSAINYSDTISHLQFAHSEIRSSQIYAVCTTCQGRGRKSCRHCKSRGFLSKQQWDMVPSEIRAMREKR